MVHIREAVSRQAVSVGNPTASNAGEATGLARSESGSFRHYSWDPVTDATERLYLRLRASRSKQGARRRVEAPVDEEPLAGLQGDMAVIHGTAPRLCVTADGGATYTTTP